MTGVNPYSTGSSPLLPAFEPFDLPPITTGLLDQVLNDADAASLLSRPVLDTSDSVFRYLEAIAAVLLSYKATVIESRYADYQEIIDRLRQVYLDYYALQVQIGFLNQNRSDIELLEKNTVYAEAIDWEAGELAKINGRVSAHNNARNNFISARNWLIEYRDLINDITIGNAASNLPAVYPALSEVPGFGFPDDLGDVAPVDEFNDWILDGLREAGEALNSTIEQGNDAKSILQGKVSEAAAAIAGVEAGTIGLGNLFIDDLEDAAGSIPSIATFGSTNRYNDGLGGLGPDFDEFEWEAKESEGWSGETYTRVPDGAVPVGAVEFTDNIEKRLNDLRKLIEVLVVQAEKILEDTQEAQAAQEGEGPSDDDVNIKDTADQDEDAPVGAGSSVFASAAAEGDNPELLTRVDAQILYSLLDTLNLELSSSQLEELQFLIVPLTTALIQGGILFSPRVLAANSDQVGPTEQAVALANAIGILVAAQQISQSDVPATAAATILQALLGQGAVDDQLANQAELLEVLLKFQLILLALLSISAYGEAVTAPVRDDGGEDEPVTATAPVNDATPVPASTPSAGQQALQDAIAALARVITARPENRGDVDQVVEQLADAAVALLPDEERDNLREALRLALRNALLGGDQIPVVNLQVRSLFGEVDEFFAPLTDEPDLITAPGDVDPDTQQEDQDRGEANLSPSVDDAFERDEPTTPPPLLDQMFAYLDLLHTGPEARYVEQLGDAFVELVSNTTNLDNINRSLLDPADQLWRQGFSLFYADIQYGGGKKGHRAVDQL